MADVLSQAQIDALLNAVRSGDKDLEQSSENQEKKYQKYDFSSPRKFTKDRIKMLNGIFDNYSRVIGSRLNGRLRSTCEITVESIEEQRYYEFSNALTEGDVLGLIDVGLKDQVQETPAMLFISTTTALSMMDRMLGGEGTVDDELDSDYSYTDLELKLFEDLAQDIVKVMGRSWENYVPISFIYSRTEVNPTLNQVIGLDETVVIVDLKMQFPNLSGRMSICLPGEVLTNIFAEISRENPIRKVAAEDKSEEIFDKLRDSKLEIIAELPSTQLSLSDIYHLNVGDVIDLGQPKETPVFLEIGGYHWFTGKMGTHKKNMAVKIDEVCYQLEQRSE
ncbi:flagellar motor switch protein FliM [uncultured Oscillibacter sp.]|uniref:flagellar motor switch protein FliM n=1 Tax=uncultured Oscillibacter sp. TaxID=876091 RepID=UPI0025E6EBB6|nr:FliM/FliN family flagellar motor switch protein [uncultured Oscillibacter sp.]